MRAWKPLFGALVAAQIAYGRRPAPAAPVATRAIVGLMLATSAAEAVAARRPARGLGLVATAGAIGFAAEVRGVRTGRPDPGWSMAT